VSRKIAKQRAPAARVEAKIAAERRPPARRSVTSGAGTAPRSDRAAAGGTLVYAARDVEQYVAQVAAATPLEIVELERTGVPGALVKDLSRRLAIPTKRMFAVLGVPKATGESKAARGERLSGSGGQAALGVVKLLGIAHDIVSKSTSPDAKAFDTAGWLGQWIERPQPALGGRKPADLLDTPTGYEVVARLLGSIESGAFQ
jgi:putative toxin-antitoxin system antitoxin component (TIGR02293 family)